MVAHALQLFGVRFADVFAEHLDAAARGALQAQHLAQQHGLAGAGAAHDGHDFAAENFQVQVLVHHGAAKFGPQAADLDHWRADLFVGLHVQRLGAAARHDDFVRHQNPTSLKMIANTASARITTVMAVTTEVVVPWPRLSVLGLMRSPKWQDTSAISTPKVVPFNRPMT